MQFKKKKIKKSESEELSKDLMEKEKRKFDEIIKECFIPVITLFDHEVFLIACDLIIKNDNKEAQNQLFIWTGLLDYKKIEKPKVDEGPVNMSIGEILFKNEPKNKEKKNIVKGIEEKAKSMKEENSKPLIIKPVTMNFGESMTEENSKPLIGYQYFNPNLCYPEYSKKLLDLGVDINTIDPFYNNTIFHVISSIEATNEIINLCSYLLDNFEPN